MRPWASAIFVVLVTLVAGVYTAVVGNEPLLGLDLQGGVSVVLEPTTDADPEALDQTVEIIRSRVDALGVAEPEISRQGSTIVVDLPGVEEQQRALELVGRTAELRFRPVLFDLGPQLTLDDLEAGTDADDGTDADADDADPGDADADGSTTTTSADADADADADGVGDVDGDEESLGAGGRLSPLALRQDATTSTTSSDDDETSTTSSDDDETSTTSSDDGATDEETDPAGAADDEFIISPEQQAVIDACSIEGVTPPEEDVPDQPVVLIDENGLRLCLGPTLLTGTALETAGVALSPTGEWTVNPVFERGADGIDSFNQAAALCYAGGPDPNICPTARLAIVLDHVVVSSPTINAPAFSHDEIVISGAFEEEGARDLAAVLRFGALPVELETQQARTVSATIGDDVLRAGVIAGLIGLAMVAVYLLAYYRLAGLVALSGLLISAVLLWAIIAWFGENLGLALTLAGVVGLIVSIGVSADSNIVYFENVKDAYRGGRRIPTSVERAYRSAISTIIKADFVSLIAAALLYFLTVGAVRGFAFYLGLATVLDLFISMLFMRPALAFLANLSAVEKRPGLLGLPSGDDS